MKRMQKDIVEYNSQTVAYIFDYFYRLENG